MMDPGAYTILESSAVFLGDMADRGRLCLPR